MDFNRYLQFHDDSGSELAFGKDWGVYAYPDGQNQIWFVGGLAFERETVCLNHPAILDLVRQAGEILGPLRLYATYMYGARSDKTASGDRRVSNVASSSRRLLREVSNELHILVPHDSPENSVEWPFPGTWSDYDGIVYPDASAKARQPWLHGCGLPEVVFEKVRDQVTGAITGLEPRGTARGRLLVADDICDGGATFVKVASKLLGCRLDLAVAHGIFSGGALGRLTEAGYDRIFTTNSYTQHDPAMEATILGRCSVTDVWNLEDAR